MQFWEFVVCYNYVLMKSELKVSESIESAIRKYCEERGFGSMNKNDFEVSIFGLLLKMQPYKGKSNYELSLLLRIPESKIKRLRYESALQNVNPNTDYKEEVYKLLETVQLRVDNNKLVFQVEDIMIKSYISSILKHNGRMLDSSFNPELVVLHLDDFQYLANEVYPEGETSRVLKEAKKLSKGVSQVPTATTKVLLVPPTLADSWRMDGHSLHKWHGVIPHTLM